MFKKTRRSFYMVTMLPIFIVFIAACVSLSVSLTINNINQYENSIANEIDIKSTNFNFEIDNLVATNQSIINNEDIKSHCIEESANSNILSNILTNKSLQYSYVLGMSIYSLDETITPLKSSRIGGQVELSEIANVSNYLDKYEGSDNFLFIRNDAINTSYDFSNYNKEFGMLSLVNKISDDNGNVIGVLITDLSSYQIYENLLNFSSLDLFANAAYYLEDDDVILKQDASTTTIEESSSSSYRKIALKDDISLVMNLDQSSLIRQNTILVITIVSIFIVLSVIIFFLLRRVINRIIEPLEALNKDMLDF